MSHTGARLLWTAVGLLVTAIGAFGTAAAFGLFAATDPRAPLLWSGLLDLWRRTAPWGLVLLAVLGVLATLAGWRLLDRLLGGDDGPAMGERDLRLGSPAGTVPGVTRVRGAALADALARDLAGRPDLVRGASVTLTGARRAPGLRIDLRLGPRVRPAAVGAHVAACVGRLTSTCGLRPEPVDVTAHLDGTGCARVR